MSKEEAPFKDPENINDDGIDDIDEDGSSIMNTLSIIFVVIVLVVLLKLIFYRDSRPEELKSVFEPFDNYLSVPQNYLNDFVRNFKEFIENKEEKEQQKAEEKKKKWDNQQVEIDLIKLRLEYENREKVADVNVNFDEEVKFWKLKIENIEKEIKISKTEHEKLENLSNIVNNNHKQVDSLLSTLNDEVNEQVKAIKETNFMPLNVDELIREIYELLFKTAVMKSFIDDLDTRREKIRTVLRYGDDQKFKNNYKEKYFYNWLLKKKENKEFVKEIELKSVEALEAKAKQVNEEFYKDLKLEKAENAAIDFGKVMRVDNSNVVTTEILVKESQEYEKELFVFLSKDLNFYGKIVDLINLKTGSMDFINEFEVVLKNNNDFEHYDILFKRLERRRLLQEQRIKKQEHANKKVDNNSVLLECWHKRNLLNMFTDRRLTTFDQFRFNEIKTIYEYSEKFNVWFKEKLLMLPHEHQVTDIKRKLENISRQSKVVNTASIEEYNDLEKILTRKLSIFDHSPYEFVLDRVLRDYSKFKGLVMPPQQNLIYYTDGYLFMAAGVYGAILRSEAGVLPAIREKWPKAVSADKSFLGDEEGFKKLVVKSVKEDNWSGPVPQSYKCLIALPPKSIPEMVQQTVVDLVVEGTVDSTSLLIPIGHLPSQKLKKMIKDQFK